MRRAAVLLLGAATAATSPTSFASRHISAPADSESPAGLVNITVYRVSPLTYPGLLNMDTGDPSGDIGFGSEPAPPSPFAPTHPLPRPRPHPPRWQCGSS